MINRDLYFIAHRGEYLALKDGESVDYAPEGSRPAYERARDQKVNGVKLDVQYTADKVIVMSHDTHLNRTAGADLQIATSTYEELRQATYLKRGEFGNEKIITFDEALEIVKDIPLYYLDFKNYSDEMLQDVFTKLEKHGISSSKVIIATFNNEALKGAQRLYPDVRRVRHVSYTDESFAEVKAQMAVLRKELGLYGFNIPERCGSTTPEFVRELKDEGCWVSVWFVHSTASADKFCNSGADAFVTGMPSSIREYLRSK